MLSGVALVAAISLGVAARQSHGTPRPVSRLVVDPNTARPALLIALPRLGPALVGRIVAERERRPFRSLEDLDTRVRGIGPVTASTIRPHLRFDAQPVNVTTDSQALVSHGRAKLP
jgi:DNA uptake protein ComE-like DNA-binding protein